ncbi:MAG: hypothetical protein JWQ87_2292 [Candidatus Sulfotelmatobacter sp.]|nr:hypothetical protein [Candidatus Sulfotelmatobacter sp.]
MGVFRREFAPQVRAIVETLEKRMLPAFAGIEDEAETVVEKAWDALMSAPGTGDEDPGDFAEAAQDAGISHYMLLNGIRQGMVNLFAAALYHAFEQQIMMFLRREVLHPREENDPRLFQMSEFQKRMNILGIDITTFLAWAKVDELRLVANTVKHAEGSAAHKLHEIRPDLFVPPQTAELGLALDKIEPRVFLPLVGEDLFVSVADAGQYRDSLLEFWQQLGDALERA